MFRIKVGLRKPSLKRSISARTTGRAKRAVKKAVIPGYGKKGMGWIKDPKKTAYNKVYRKTTFGGLSGSTGCLLPMLMFIFFILIVIYII